MLLIYIHGFLGTETSFQSFPAHVHNLVTVTLADTHVVHTKVYPRYKSKKAIEFARDDFSNWLCPHESANTDVILLGHSIGGILAAEVALLPPYSSMSTEKFRHRILGTIHFDCPLLGMHPGVVVSGIGSLFRPTPESSGPQASDMTTELRSMPASSEISLASLPEIRSADSASIQSSDYSTFTNSNTDPTISANPGSANTPKVLLSPTVSCQDPNFNPRFVNDTPTPVRKGWDSAIHFVTKHSDGLSTAAKSLVTSHLEFGGCLADYKGLKNRYSRLKALDDSDPHRGNHAPRIRFINYYTASTGRPKRLKPPPSKSTAQLSQRCLSGETLERELQDVNLSNHCSPSLPQSPRISVKEYQDGGKILKATQDSEECTSVASSGCSPGDTAMSNIDPEMDLLDPVPITDNESGDNAVKANDEDSQSTSDIVASTANAVSVPSKDDGSETQGQVKEEIHLLLPPLPPTPEQPPPFSPSSYTDKDARNLAQKEYSRQNKAYMQALKDYGKAIKDREKLMEKKAKATRKASEKEAKLNNKESLKAKREEAKLKSTPAPSASNPATVRGVEYSLDGSSDDKRVTGSEANKQRRDKKFCMLPPKINNQIDPCWVRVFMRDVDEVGAHCGLFFLGDQYEWLVSDVGSRIKEWVRER